MRTTILLPGAALLSILALSACETTTMSASSTVAADATPAEAAAAADVTASVAMPAGLTSEQQFIWSTMTPEAQAQAVAFIAAGGTFAQFIAV